MNRIVLALIKFYQKYLTILSYGSCRFHPTCSSYAKTQFENNNFFKAIYFSTLRIVKCNPLCDGGFDYPRINCPTNYKINQNFKQIKIKYWFVPTQDNQCLVVRHNKKWEQE